MNKDAIDILNIPLDRPDKFFKSIDIDNQWKRLRVKWHPDTTKEHFDTKDIFIHITKLYQNALLQISNNSWKGVDTLQFTDSSNKIYKFKYLSKHVGSDFELGPMYIGNTNILYVIDDKYKNLFDNGINQIKDIKYPYDFLEKEFSIYLPKIKYKDNLILVIEKPKNAVLLKDLIDYLPNKRIDPLHVAWIVNGLFNITTLLDFVGICHNSILDNTVFVDPINHSVHLLGGWWYSTKENQKLKAIPKELLTKSILETGKTKSIHDRKAIKRLALQCLGDSLGNSLYLDDNIPKDMISWLKSSNIPDALQDYEAWENLLKNIFGKRKFIKWNIDTNEIY